MLDAVLKQATKVQRQTNKTPRNEQVTAHDQATPSVGSSGSSQHQRLQAASGAWARGKAGASGHAHSAVREMMADDQNNRESAGSASGQVIYENQLDTHFSGPACSFLIISQ